MSKMRNSALTHSEEDKGRKFPLISKHAPETWIYIYIVFKDQRPSRKLLHWVFTLGLLGDGNLQSFVATQVVLHFRTFKLQTLVDKNKCWQISINVIKCHIVFTILYITVLFPFLRQPRRAALFHTILFHLSDSLCLFWHLSLRAYQRVQILG